MNNPEYGSQREPSTIEQGQRFSSLLENLGNVRHNFLKKELPGVDLSEEQQQELFQNFETKKADAIIQHINPVALGWFSTPESSGSEASDLEASADLFIDTYHKQVTRFETTGTSEHHSTQNSIRTTYELNPLGELTQQQEVTRELFDQRGEPSIDEDIENITATRQASARLGLSDPTHEEIVGSSRKLYSGSEAKMIVDDLSKIIVEIIRAYSRPGLMINQETYLSSPDNQVYVIESADD